jgi:hypothetical protein
MATLAQVTSDLQVIARNERTLAIEVVSECAAAVQMPVAT